MFDEYNDILTVPELAEALRIGSTQAYRLLQQKKISGFKEGKDWKIPKTALIDYIQKMSHNSQQYKKSQKHIQASVAFLSYISLTYLLLVWYTGLLYCSHDSFLSNQYFLPTESKSIATNLLLRDSSCYELCGILFFFDLTQRTLHSIFQRLLIL